MRDHGWNSPRTAPVSVQCRLVAVNHTSESVTDSEARWLAFRMTAELLVGFRRIFTRGLVKLHGSDWVDRACPPDVRTSLENWRDMELEVERTGAAADEPIDYTSFGDLADILEADEALSVMLSSLSSSPDGLSGSLRTLDDVRRKVAGARPLSDSESLVLSEMHVRLKEKLAGAKRRVRASQSEADAAEETPGVADLGEPAAVPDETPTETDETAVGVQPGTDNGDVVGETTADAEKAEDAVAVSGRSVRPASSRAAEVFDGASTPVGLVHVETADLEILRDLRLEIIAAAEAAYSYSNSVSTTVWSRVWESGWFVDKLETYGLGDVSTFYAVLEGYMARHQRGDNRESLRTFLADRELAKLLLRLRELFDRLRV